MIEQKQHLKYLADQIQKQHLHELFQNDHQRFDRLSQQHEHLIFDFSKQHLNEEILDKLIHFAKKNQVEQWIKQLFSDQKINYTEQRPAMHWALRLPEHHLQHQSLATLVHQQLKRMFDLVEQIHAGQYRGFTGEVIQDVVNIGVGGSDLGPVMVSQALSDFKRQTSKDLNLHFVSTIDGSQLSDILHKLRPETTLFIISSKSFSTIDTLSNAQTAKLWLESSLGESKQFLKHHFIGVSTHADKMSAWGIAPEKQFLLWEWVGGRYSLWSCIGLPIALSIGVGHFKRLLAGAHSIDQHFQTTELRHNIPVLMALIGIWNINFLNINTHAILPYDGHLKYFTSYLQQLEMESNGKSIQRNHQPVEGNTCPIIWGEVGPNAQHAFYQLLHQGTSKVSCDFIAPIHRYDDKQFGNIENKTSLIEQHYLALSNCLAQSRLLAFGNYALNDQSLAELPKYKHYGGNQPSSTLLIKSLDPYSLGMLIALYEHKVFVQSVLWNINPFDQWGVEKGKEIANELLPILTREHPDLTHLDDSTRGLIQAIQML